MLANGTLSIQHAATASATRSNETEAKKRPVCPGRRPGPFTRKLDRWNTWFVSEETGQVGLNRYRKSPRRPTTTILISPREMRRLLLISQAKPGIDTSIVE